MHVPIMVNYVPNGKDWTVTVTDEEQTQNTTASGLIAARDQADQIVEKMVPNETGRTVVHLLEGDAVAFTNSYLQIRLGLTTPVAPKAGTADLAADPATDLAGDLAAPEGAVPSPTTTDPTGSPTSAPTPATCPVAEQNAPPEEDKTDQTIEVAGSSTNQVN